MRTADLLFTLSKAVPNMSASGRKSLLAKMTSARRELSLFQHHDGALTPMQHARARARRTGRAALSHTPPFFPH